MEDKIFVKLTRAIGTHKAGAILEVEAPIGRAYIETGSA